MVIRDRKNKRRRSADIVVLLVFPTDATFVVVGKIEIILSLCFTERNAAHLRAERETERKSSASSVFAREGERVRVRVTRARLFLSLCLSLSLFAFCSKFLEKTLCSRPFFSIDFISRQESSDVYAS